MPPAAPGGSVLPVITFTATIAGDPTTFDAPAYKAKLAAMLEGVDPSAISLTISAASVQVLARIVAPTPAVASSALGALQAATPAALTNSLGVSVLAKSLPPQWALEVIAASPPPAPPALPVPLPVGVNGTNGTSISIDSAQVAAGGGNSSACVPWSFTLPEGCDSSAWMGANAAMIVVIVCGSLLVVCLCILACMCCCQADSKASCCRALCCVSEDKAANIARHRARTLTNVGGGMGTERGLPISPGPGPHSQYPMMGGGMPMMGGGGPHGCGGMAAGCVGPAGFGGGYSHEEAAVMRTEETSPMMRHDGAPPQGPALAASMFPTAKEQKRAKNDLRKLEREASRQAKKKGSRGGKSAGGGMMGQPELGLGGAELPYGTPPPNYHHGPGGGGMMGPPLDGGGMMMMPPSHSNGYQNGNGYGGGGMGEGSGFGYSTPGTGGSVNERLNQRQQSVSSMNRPQCGSGMSHSSSPNLQHQPPPLSSAASSHRSPVPRPSISARQRSENGMAGPCGSCGSGGGSSGNVGGSGGPRCEFRSNAI